MKCPSCNDIVPDDSMFCMNCGSVFKASTTQKKELLNTKTPVKISSTLVWFEKEMEKVKPNWLTGDKNMLLRKWTIALQLLDENNKTTASDGVFIVKIDFRQVGQTSSVYGQTEQVNVTRSGFNKEIGVSLNDFYRATGDGGKIWYKYENPNHLEIKTGFSVTGEIEVWFTPNGNSKKLYLKDTFHLLST
jgi:hypothetical protein